MVTKEGLDFLRGEYGDHPYEYPYLSDTNVWSVIKKHDCKTYEELDKHCKHLNQIVKEIEEMKSQCKE